VIDRRYHHGDLRAALLEQAEATLRESGVERLSLRELARSVGVSHGAPRRHFDDKSALLEALAADGFRRLGSTMAGAAAPRERNFTVVLKDVAIAYVRFATENAALIDLMSSNRYLANATAAFAQAREMSFAPVRQLIEWGQANGDLAPGDVRRTGTLILATLHGLATMSINGMIDASDESLLSDAVESLLNGLAPIPLSLKPSH
jgi:AcrR family transcriptional regulator